MLSKEASCSDCKIELIERKWTQLLLKWINKCVTPNQRVKRLNPKSLSDIMTKYKKDVCRDDIDRAMLCTDDMEPFLKYKYPILRLRYLSEDKDYTKKQYIMTSMLLYHCCINSQTGIVDEDICKQLNKYEQELVLKFCEKLSEMETTIDNVLFAIRDAFESTPRIKSKTSKELLVFQQIEATESSDTAAQMSSSSTTKSSIMSLASDNTIRAPDIQSVKPPVLKFNSSVTVMPSVITDTSTYSDIMNMYASDNLVEQNTYDSDENDMEDQEKLYKYFKNVAYKDKRDEKRRTINEYAIPKHQASLKDDVVVQRYDLKDSITNKDDDQTSDNSLCQPGCSCSRCISPGPCCGDLDGTMKVCDRICDEYKKPQKGIKLSRFELSKTKKMIYGGVSVIVLLTVLIVLLLTVYYQYKKKNDNSDMTMIARESAGSRPLPMMPNTWQCKKNLCQKVYRHTNDYTYPSKSRCSLLCTGPQIWPIPIGTTHYSKKLIALVTKKLEYKLMTVPSDAVNQYLAEAFKLFIGDLARLENTGRKYKSKNVDLPIQKMNIQINVESDHDPKLRLNTEESYNIVVDSNAKQVVIKISASSFCGVRHGLETLTQMILLDESSGYLITLSKAVIKDAPSYKYRGLMIDTGRNYISVADLMRTVDAMATVKLNTFHWRISDVSSFPLNLSKIAKLFEYGAYDTTMVYTKKDIQAIVRRAGIRGIRVLLEVAVPGPIGRAWSWRQDTSCPSKNNETCDNILCLRLNIQDSVLDDLQIIYKEILEMTEVTDIFHLSNGVFSLTNCFKLIEDRVGFLDKALERLKLANNGFLPSLPIIWYSSYLANDIEAISWERFGVQLNDWKQRTSDHFLSKFKVIHSSKWDLSCEMKKLRCQKYRTWQEMYSWKSWRKLEAFTVEGGEAILWTDLVNSGNIDYHLWPRTAAVAERLWSDIVTDARPSGSVYVRLDSHRSRMLRDGVTVPPIWPKWCSFNPGICLEKLQQK